MNIQWIESDSLAGRYDNPIPTRFLAPIDCLKIQALPVIEMTRSEMCGFGAFGRLYTFSTSSSVADRLKNCSWSAFAWASGTVYVRVGGMDRPITVQTAHADAGIISSS